ncbi:MAG TPA: glycosyltransferase family A protein [Candidatus Sulfotelmatobacter sp.]|jgi:rhamnosyltransferase|nr:glycosyltransferase family A protein [Candidatus Sulfotelmatobacter sp.]
MVEVSVLLLTKNGCDDLERMLPALFSQTVSAPFEVIAVDSGSSDGTLDVLRRFPVCVRQILPGDFHHARTRNLAASLARGKIVAFLSQDAVPASGDWLAALLANFHDPQVGAVYGRQIPRHGSSLERQDALNAIYGENRIVKDPMQRDGLGYRFYHFSDVNAAIRRDVWETAPFPEDLKVFEDLGIAKHILDGGWKIVYEPKAAVLHSHIHTTLGLFKRYFDIGYTFRFLKIWEAPGIRASLLRDGWKLVNGKIKRIRSGKTRASAGYGIRQDLAKSIGLFLGLNENRLPLVLKRRLSAHRVFG